jgi:hypothetical protein
MASEERQQEEQGDASVPARKLRHRRHRSPGEGRDGSPGGRTITLSYDGQEFADVAAAAHRAGLRPTSFVAAAALAVARESAPPVPSPLRDALAELNQARTLVGRFGVNVNQAVAAYNTTGQAPPELLHATQLCARAVARLDEVVLRMQGKLP